MKPRHPSLLRALSRAESLVDRSGRMLRSLDVYAAHGVRVTRSAQRDGWDDWESIRSTAAPCFTLSPGRSGTMSLTRLASLCPDFEAVHEPHPTLLVESFLAHQGIEPNSDFWLHAVEQARDWMIKSAHYRGRTWFETNNRITPLASVFASLYPQSRFIVLTRHPVDFCASALARGYYERHPWDFARLHPMDGQTASAWSEMEQIERIGWLWSETTRLALDMVDRLDPDRFVIARSEDLFIADTGVAKNLLRFAGARKIPSDRQIRRVLDVPLNAQSIRPRGSVPDDWKATDRQKLRDRVRATMDRLDYAF